MGEVFETIGFVAIFVGMLILLLWTAKKQNIKRGKENNEVIGENQPKQSQPEPLREWHCPYCGALNQAHRDECLNCGARAK